MKSLLREIFETGKVINAGGQALPLHSHVPRLECEIIQTWIMEHRPRRLLEVGFAYGISSLFICEAIEGFEQVSHDIIDPFQRTTWQSVGILNLERAGYAGQYTWHEQPSETCLPQMLARRKQFDFALIDGFHTFDHALVDFFYINQMLAVGGMIIFDDVQLPAIEMVLAHVATYPCYQILSLPDSFQKNVQVRGRLMMNKPPARVAGFVKTKDDDRPWDWHHEF